MCFMSPIQSVCEYMRMLGEYRICALQSAGSLSTWVMNYIDKTNLFEGNESTLRLFTEITYFLILSDKKIVFVVISNFYLIF